LKSSYLFIFFFLNFYIYIPLFKHWSSYIETILESLPLPLVLIYLWFIPVFLFFLLKTFVINFYPILSCWLPYSSFINSCWPQLPVILPILCSNTSYIIISHLIIFCKIIIILKNNNYYDHSISLDNINKHPLFFFFLFFFTKKWVIHYTFIFG